MQAALAQHWSGAHAGVQSALPQKSSIQSKPEGQSVVAEQLCGTQVFT
jgi:hypothetical protein